MGKGIVWAAVCQHLVWALSLFVSPDPLGVTAIFTLQHVLVSRQFVALFILVAALMSAWGLMRCKPGVKGLLWCVPQQLLLMSSATGAAQCILNRQFADGVARSFWFMLPDQVPSILFALFHTGSLIDLYAPRLIRKRMRVAE